MPLIALVAVLLACTWASAAQEPKAASTNACAGTGDERAAHRGVIHSSKPSSPVNRLSLPVTCGERQCRLCHSVDRDERASVARRELEGIAALRTDLSGARFRIAGVIDPQQQESLKAEWTAADRAYHAVIAAVHSFDLPPAGDRLSDAKTRTEQLVVKLKTRAR